MTRPGKGRGCAADLLGRDLSATAPDLRWCGDGTEIPTGRAGSTSTPSRTCSPGASSASPWQPTTTRPWPRRRCRCGRRPRRDGHWRGLPHRPRQRAAVHLDPVHLNPCVARFARRSGRSATPTTLCLCRRPVAGLCCCPGLVLTVGLVVCCDWLFYCASWLMFS